MSASFSDGISDGLLSEIFQAADLLQEIGRLLIEESQNPRSVFHTAGDLYKIIGDHDQALLMYTRDEEAKHLFQNVTHEQQQTRRVHPQAGPSRVSTPMQQASQAGHSRVSTPMQQASQAPMQQASQAPVQQASQAPVQQTNPGAFRLVHRFSPNAPAFQPPE